VAAFGTAWRFEGIGKPSADHVDPKPRCDAKLSAMKANFANEAASPPTTVRATSERGFVLLVLPHSPG